MERNLEQYRTPGQALSALLIEKGWNGRVLARIYKLMSLVLIGYYKIKNLFLLI